MQFKSRKPKPPTGMEMSVTFMMPDGQTVEDAKAALLKFLETVPTLSKEIGSAWLRTKITGIQPEFEGAMQAAFDKLNKRPELSLVVDNTPPAGTEEAP